MRAAAFCPNDTTAPAYKSCAELAVAIGAVKVGRQGPAREGEHSPASTLQPAFDAISDLAVLEPLPAAEAAEIVARGGNPTRYDMLLLPDLSAFRSVRDFARRLRQWSAWGVAVYLAPYREPMNQGMALIETLAVLDEHAAERVAAAEAEAKLAQQMADAKYGELYKERVAELKSRLRIVEIVSEEMFREDGTVSPALGAVVRDFREANGLTLKDLAQRLRNLGVTEGLSDSNLSRFETTGRGAFPKSAIEALLNGEGADVPAAA